MTVTAEQTLHDLREMFRKNGFVVVSNLLTTEALSAVRDECELCISMQGADKTVVRRGCILEPLDFRLLSMTERSNRDAYW